MRSSVQSQILFVFVLAMTVSACQPTVGDFGADGTGSEGSGSGSGSGGSSEDFEASPRMGDRNLVVSILTGLFVPSSVSTGDSNRIAIETAIRNHVGNQYIDFGSACDQLTVDRGATDPCFTGSTLNESALRVPGFVRNTSVRSALSLRAIYGILATGSVGNMAIQNIVALTRGLSYSSVSLGSLTKPSRTDLALLYALVYPGSTASSESIDKLESLSALQANALEAWRFVTIAILSTLLWQVP